MRDTISGQKTVYESSCLNLFDLNASKYLKQFSIKTCINLVSKSL